MKIIITLGPKSLNERFLQWCLEHELYYFRLNGSHLKGEKLDEYSRVLREFFSEGLAKVYLDLQGSKMRVGVLAESRRLNVGEIVPLVLGEAQEKNQIGVPYSELFDGVKLKDKIVLQDGSIELEVLEVNSNFLRASVLRGDVLRSQAGIEVFDRLPVLEKIPTSQKEQIQRAKNFHFDYLALSYVTSLEDLETLKKSCFDAHYQPKIVAKIEHPQALKQMKEIIKGADEIWFCRGDLGGRIPLKELGYWQEKTIEESQKQEKPVIVAGQVFQHLTEHLQPTRSEVVHFYHLQKQGVNGIVLSDETAIGNNPQEGLEQILNLLC